ncbi:MAG: energy transducer TonB family protein [Halarcobacter sp.]
MRIIIFAFLISIIIHLLLFSPLIKIKKDIKQPISTSKVIDKSTVRYVKLQPKPKPKKVEQKPKVNTKVPKKFKKVEQKKVVPQKKAPKQKSKKVIPKPIKLPKEKKQLFKINKDIKPVEKRKTIKKKSLENLLLTEPIPLDKNLLDDITKSYVKLYGQEYNSMTKIQKVFIQSKIKDIVEITRQYYRFPRIAIKLRKNDFNIVEFKLHPNGDISDLKIVQKGEYSFYDKSIIEAIEIAYKDYPRPKETTKIKFYLTYTIY